MPDTDTVPIGTTESPGAALGMDGYDSKLKDVADRLKPLQAEKTAADDKIYSGIEATTDRLLPRIEQLSKDAGVEAEKMKPWNADEEANKRRTDPIEAFASFGSVFGILASAFTHAPMENALNASASAVTAIKEGDKTAYERAFQAQEHNFKMAMERQKIQHEAYQDATSLLNTNLAAAQTKLQVNAARFGDKQIATLLEMGYPPDQIMKTINAREELRIKMEEEWPKIQMANAEMSRLFALGYDPKNPTDPKSQEALQKYKQEQVDLKQAERAYTPEQQAYAQYIKENPKASADERADYIKRLRTRKDLTPEQEATTRWIEEHPEGTAEELKQFVTDLRAKSRGTGGAGNTALTKDRQIAADVDKLVEQYKKDHPDAKEAEIAEYRASQFKHLGTAAASASGNRVDDIQKSVDQIGTIEQTIDKLDGLIAKHKGIVGLGGTVTRPAESISNLFGSNETDRRQAERYILEIQELLPRALTGANGRPLASDVSKINGIAAGLRFGDTSANTVRAYRELKELLTKTKGDLEKRKAGGSEPASKGEAKPADAPWLRDPVVE